MRVYKKNNNLILENVQDFDLAQTFECGQCFRWEKTENGYIGVAYSRVLRIIQNGSDVTLCGVSMADWDNIWHNYFDFGRDYSRIKNRLSTDDVMKQAIGFGCGIRILNQEPFECLVSFIISASNNIPRIKKIIDSLCRNFGKPINYENNTYYTFPSADVIANLSLSELGVIKAGFRDKYILNAAKCVKDGMIDLECLKNASTEYAKTELLKLSGVGSKVAECVMLFSLGKSSSFPVDVWIKRIVEHCYFGSEQTKENISHFAAEKFSDLGGFAQQYLFYWARENKIGI